MTHCDDVLVLCKNDNYYLKTGLMLLIRSVLQPGANVRISDDFSAVGISKADIIVMDSPSLLLYLCHPNFRFRKSHSVVISLHNKQGSIRNQDLPSCFNDVMIFRRDETLSWARTLLAQKIAVPHSRAPFNFSSLNCMGCKCRHLSRCQLQIVKYLRQGYSMQCIARILHVSVKTVYSHKYRLMEKFDAKGDAELNQFINLLSLDELSGRAILENGIKLI